MCKFHQGTETYFPINIWNHSALHSFKHYTANIIWISDKLEKGSTSQNIDFIHQFIVDSYQFFMRSWNIFQEKKALENLSRGPSGSSEASLPVNRDQT